MGAPITWDALTAAATDPAVTVVTPNRRLAASIERAVDAAQLALGRRVWRRADVLSFHAFVEREWRACTAQSAAPPPRLLSEHALLALWERAIRDSLEPDAALLHPAKAAREAREAARLAHAWQLWLAYADEALPEDAALFLDWSDRHARLRADLRAVSAAELPGLLARQAAAALRPWTGRRLFIVGFDLATPQQDHLWRALAGAGAAVHVHRLAEAGTGRVRRHVFETESAELAACARWVRAQLEGAANCRVAIVAPDVARIKPALSRALAEALTPERLMSPRPDGVCDPALVNFSLGDALGDQGLVRDALTMLQATFAADAAMPVARWRALLLSPHLAGGARERADRARLDAESAASMPLDLGFAAWMRALRNPAWGRWADACPRWFAAVDSARAAGPGGGPGRRALAEWVQAFTAALKAWGFPGETALDSPGFQCLAAFHESLSELGRTALGRQRTGAPEILALLGRQLADTPFQIETPGAKAPVEVLGVLESAGLRFDALWVLGLDEDHWPLSARRHPFLPPLAQQRLPIPETSREASLEVDRRLTQAWTRAAAEVVLSHARRPDPGSAGAADERLREASALVCRLAESPFEGGAHQTLADALVAGVACEPVADTPAPPLPEGTHVRGGAAVLRDQAACPFRAFARHRLGATSLDLPRVLPDALARGNVLHRALSLLWAGLQDRAALDRPDLPDQVERAADRALAEARAANLLAFPGRIADLERERLVRVLTAWLEVEQGRQEFSVVGNEATREAEVGGLAMRLRLDRIDRLHDGTFALVDYKTGAAQPAAWMGERPDEPQLPLYYATSADPVSTVAFARLKRGPTWGFAGFSATDGLLPGAKPVESIAKWRDQGLVSWDVLTAQWDATVTALARAFLQGAAAVDPKDQGAACRRCDLHALCRIADAGTAVARAGEAEEA
ncbi:MAG: PD-(D/E)XK nuclease family protein [Betaproteobacteria bacterium]|nr:PD-(D/E)XK nuclease family protein [Betaproteobacteria bacterium]